MASDVVSQLQQPEHCNSPLQSGKKSTSIPSNNRFSGALGGFCTICWGTSMRIVGAIFILLGFLISLSIIGAVIGIPMMFIGLVMVIFGGRRKTVITNVIQVSNNGGAPHYSSTGKEGAASEPQLRAWSGQSVPAMPMAPRLVKASPPIDDGGFELSYDDAEFVDARTELSQVAKQILGQAKKDGFAVTARPTSVTVRGGDHVEELKSNQAIYDFGQDQGYNFQRQ